LSTEIALYLATGAGAGLLAGLLGIGGGLVIVPALAAFLPVPEPVRMHVAIGTSLASIVFTALSSAFAHHCRGALRLDLVLRLAPGLMLGALMGAALADQVRSTTLSIVFALFLLLVAALLASGGAPQAHRRLPGAVGTGMAGVLIGGVSGVVGIGGGTLTVPFLTWCQVPVRQAIAVSAACGFPIALAGAAGFMVFGADAAIASASGYVYWPAFAGVTLASVGLSPAGAALAHALPVVLLRRVFAGFAVLVALKILHAAGVFA
jgi:uncharacterized protein